MEPTRPLKYTIPLKLRLAIVALWLLLVGLGLTVLYRYSNAAGRDANPKSSWPSQSDVTPMTERATLLVFVHPSCPCSRATIGELERLLPRTADSMNVTVFFFKPRNKPAEWAKASLWDHVQSIPGVEARVDEDGAEAEKYGAQTSGQVFLYDSRGRLVFFGGITPERGHMGDSAGRASILSFFKTGRVLKPKTSVFGCSIRNPERAVVQEDPRG